MSLVESNIDFSYILYKIFITHKVYIKDIIKKLDFV